MARVAEIAEAVERIAPASLAEEWDNPGLQVGDPGARVGGVLVALTPLQEVFAEAEEAGTDFLLFHHPLIFGGLSSVDASSYPGSLVARAVRGGLNVFAAHTNYDAAPNGVSVALADALGLEGPLSVVAPRGALRKLVVFVPEEAVEKVADTLSAAGAGVIGDYTRCTFRTPGTGTFFGGEAADPYLGEKGRLEKVGEVRLQTVVPAHAAGEATAAARDAHPYEEPALDVYPLGGHPEGCGYGRVGRLSRPLSAGELRELVSGSQGFSSRLVADPDPSRRIEPVAVLGGSGASFVSQAAACGAEAYIT